MDFIENYKVYIKINENNRIIEINSSAFISSTEEWIKIDEGLGDKYHHAQGNYLDMPLIDFDGTHNFKLADGRVEKTTSEEKAEEKASFKPPEPTASEDIMSLVVDQEYRLTLLELGITEG